MDLRTPCIEWPNAKTSDGYGVKQVDGKPMYVHRWVIEKLDDIKLTNQDVVRHQCDNPPCFRYDHLKVGTYGQNLQEAWERGLRGPSFQTMKTHCPKGHEYSEENTYEYKGHRSCKECRKERTRLWKIERRKNGS